MNKVIKNKICINCNKEFEICYNTDSGSGSANALRKKYCSKECKINFNKLTNNSEKKIQINCYICSKIFYKFKSTISTEFTTCSKECRHKLQSVLLSNDKTKTDCNYCKKQFSVSINSNKKYCSVDCSNKSKKLSRNNCLICNKVVRKHSHKYCSQLCSNKAQSMGIKKVFTRGICGYRNDINNFMYFKSSFEADYARYLIYNNIKFEYENKTFEVENNGKIHNYTPDFYLTNENKFIEIKGGNKKYLHNLFKVDILKNQGINIEIVTFDIFKKMLNEEILLNINFEFQHKKDSQIIINKQK